MTWGLERNFDRRDHLRQRIIKKRPPRKKIVKKDHPSVAAHLGKRHAPAACPKAGKLA
jgi:hypothetical protein